jgi:hypothetical protein
MPKNITPRVEYTHYLDRLTIDDPDGPLGELALDEATAQALLDAGVTRVAEVLPLFAGIKAFGRVPPKGLGKVAREQIATAVAKWQVDHPPIRKVRFLAGDEVALIIRDALEIVQKRVGAEAAFASMNVIYGDRLVLVIRWGAGANWHAAARACKHADPHFHEAPARRAGGNDQAVIVEE